MKKIVIFLFVACALFAFSCNKYCNCRHFVDGEVDRTKDSRFVKESELSCDAFSTAPIELEGVTYEVRCR